MKQKIRGKAIALKCIDDTGSPEIFKNRIYLGFPAQVSNQLFEIYIPFRYSKYKTLLSHKTRFIPINPIHKYDPTIF